MPKKTLSLALLAFALAATALRGDEARVPIHARMAQFDLGSGTTHYSGGVTVDIPGLLKLACEDLVAVPAPGTDRIETLTATTNVVLDVVRPGKTPAAAPMQIRATGDMAVFTATNNLVVLTGPFGNQPHVDTVQFRTRADVISYDLATGRVVALSNHITEVNPELFKKSGLFNRTNKPAKTESP